MKIIPNWQDKNLLCHFCGETRSVKYFVTLGVGKLSDNVPCCNRCALLISELSAIREEAEERRKCDE